MGTGNADQMLPAMEILVREGYMKDEGLRLEGRVLGPEFV